MSQDNELFNMEQARLQGGRLEAVKRLLRYAMQFKRTLLVALLILAVAVAADLAGPFVAKRLIDEHISGIERVWYETQDTGKYAVSYDGKRYKREDHFGIDETKGEPARVLQVGRDYYLINGSTDIEGQRSMTDGGLIQIAQGSKTTLYEGKKLDTVQLFTFFKPEVGGIWRLCLIYFGLILLSALFTYLQRYYLQSSANQIIRRMRMDVFGQLNRLPIRYFDNLPAGKVVSRITNDTEAIRELYVTVLANFFTGTIYMLGIFGALFLLNVKLAAICLFIVPVLVLWIYLYGKISSRYNRTIRATVSEINGTINESIQGMPIIKAFRQEKKIEQEFEAHNKKLFDYNNKLLNLNSLTEHNLVGVIRNAALVALIWYFGGISLTGPSDAITLGVLYAFVDYVNRLFNPIVSIVNQLPNLETALVSAERVFVLLDEEGEDVSDRTMNRYKGNVQFDNVTFAYREGEDVLKGISFEARQGQTVALVGHTGSGKSSILNLLFRFYDVSKGKITIDGEDIRNLPRQMMRRHMGIVLQDPFLFTGTIASNVSLNDPSVSRERVEQALADVGADRLLRNLPKGIDEPVIEKGSTLSAGQRQLISFARAIAFDPAILILDEATSNIDTETEALIQHALEVVKKGRTTFVIAHRLSTIKSADLILVLDKGQIAEQGNHDELMRLKGKYYQMYQIQQGNSRAVV